MLLRRKQENLVQSFAKPYYLCRSRLCRPLITKEGRVWTPPYAACHGRFSRLLPCAKHKAIRECQQEIIFWMQGLWQIFRGNQEAEGGVVRRKI